MKKLLLPFAIGLIIGLGLTTLIVGFLRNDPPTIAESLSEELGPDVAHGDSGAAHSDSTGAENSADHLALTDSTGAHLPTDSLAVGDSAALAHDETAPDDAPAAAPGTTAGASMSTADLAKLFSSMQARDAAKVLEQLDDFEVQVILNQLGNRQAAAILSSLAPERAAVLSRAVIRGERSSL